jgi:hypothetical protein
MPSIALRLLDHGDQTRQCFRIEARRYCYAPPTDQFNQ